MLLAWGCGEYAKNSIQTMRTQGVRLDGIIDKNCSFSGSFCGIQLYSVEWVKDHIIDIDNIVITSIKYRDEIMLSALSCGIAESRIYFWDKTRLSLVSVKDSYSFNVFSQDGEECYLRDRFSEKDDGFYGDVGAHHPYRFSNTMWAYDKGWHGINIEPNIDLFRLFSVLRQRDININVGIADKDGSMTYYKFEEPAYNTFDKKMSDLYINEGNRLIETSVVEIRSLASVLEEYKVKNIDFINIDVEGLEMKVLSTLDFNMDIGCILLEQLFDIDKTYKSPEYIFLKSKGFDIEAIFGRTVIYERRN